MAHWPPSLPRTPRTHLALLVARPLRLAGRTFHAVPTLRKDLRRSTESLAKRRDRSRRLGARRQQARLELRQAAPDPVLGYRSGNEAYWLQSELRKLILDREEVWASGAASASTVSAPELSSGLVGAAPTAHRLESSPVHLNWSLTEEDRLLLERDLDQVETQVDALRRSQPQLDSARPRDSAQASPRRVASTAIGNDDRTQTEVRDEKRDQLLRIIDLRNGDSGAVHGATVRRICQAFGRLDPSTGRMDTGSAEVQSATPWHTSHGC